MEVVPLAQPGAQFQQRLPPGPGGPDRQGRSVADERAGFEAAGNVDRGRFHPAEVGDPLGIDEEGNHDDHGVAVGNRGRGVGGRVQPLVSDRGGQSDVEFGLPGERFLTGIDQGPRPFD